MIGRQLDIGSAAAQALVTVVVKQRFEFGGGEAAPGGGFSSATATTKSRRRFWIGFNPTAESIPARFGVGLCPSFVVLVYRSTVGPFPSA